MRVNEIFGPAHQGEIDVGRLSIFIRLSGCNLNCPFCDTKYHVKGNQLDINKIGKRLEKIKGVYDIVITGGEPMLQKEDVFLLIELYPLFQFHLETNGTIFDNRLGMFDSISCSPKKEAYGIKEEWNKAYSALSQMDNVRWKFVYENKDDCWWEQFQKDFQIPSNKIWIMPEGMTKEEQLKKMEEVAQYSLNKHYNFALRGHVLTYGNRRGV